MDNHIGAPKEQVAVQAEEGEAVRGLLKWAKLADISIDVLHGKTPIPRISLPGYALLQGELEEETASKNVTVSPKPETARGLLKWANLTDISLDVLHIETPISRVFLRAVYPQAGLSIR